MTNHQSLLIAASVLLAGAAVSLSVAIANLQWRTIDDDLMILIKPIPGLIAAVFGILMILNAFDGMRNEERRDAEKEAEKAR